MLINEELGLSDQAAAEKEAFEIKVTYLPDGDLCTCDSTARLSHGTASVRVIRDKQQIEDMAGAQFEKMGFQVEEKERLIETAYEVQLSMVQLEYSILLAVVCLSAGILLFAGEKNKNA